MNLPVKRVLNQLYKSIDDSQYKLFFLKVPGTKSWRLAEVDLLSTDPHEALNYGRYHVKWWTPSLTDRKTRTVKECRFMPDIRTVNKDTVGRRHCIRHSRAKAAVESDKTIQWMSGVVHLTEDRIVGPFDFETVRQPVKQGAKRKASSETERVPEFIWTQLERRGPECDIDVTNIHARVEDPDAL